MNKLVSVILCVTVLFSCICTVSANEELIFSQSFNSVPTNAQPADMAVVGKGARVIEYSENEKGLGFFLGRSAQLAVIDAQLEGKYFISFDMKASDKIDGAIKIQKGTSNSMSVLKFSDGKICTHNGRAICGIPQKMANITLEIDSDRSSYSLYVGNKCYKENFFISKFNVRSASQVSFEFISDNAAEVVVDNINIGNGKRRSSYPIDEYDPAEIEYSAADSVVTDEVYFNMDFAEGKRMSAAFQAKDNTLKKVKAENGEEYCYFKRSGVQDFHLDVGTAGYPSSSLVYQYDVRLISSSVRFQAQIKSSSDNYFTQFYVLDGVLYAGNARATVSTGTWHTISVVYNVDDSIYDVYLDYECIASDLTVNYLYRHEEASVWRVHVNRTSGDDEFCVDNMYIYGGTQPRTELVITENTDVVIDESRSCLPSETPYKSTLAGKVSYHTRSGVVYANDKKTLINPVIENGVTFVPPEFFEFSFGSEISDGDSELTVDNLSFEADSDIMTVDGTKKIKMQAPAKVIDGKWLVPMRNVVSDGFGKTVTYDNSAVSGGFIIIGDTAFKAPASDKLQELNDFILYLRPDSEKIAADFEKSSLKGTHPRVIADSSDFSRVRELVKTDANMHKWSEAIISQADGYVADPTPLIYELRDGVRLWFVSQDMMRNMTVLGMAYQLTGDKKYAERAWIDLKSVSEFPSWHPEHHIDVGGLALGVAIGYDWMYDAYTDEQHKIVEKGAYQNGFIEYIEGYQGRSNDMKSGVIQSANHNMVMNAGSTLMSLAFMDIYPKESAYCVSEALKCIEIAIPGYAPEGAWFEGMSYSAMTLEYLSYQLSALKKVFGNVYTLDASEGLDKVGYYFLYMQSAMGSFSYADVSSQGITFDPGVMWLCEHFGDYNAITAFAKCFDIPASVRALLWYNPQKLSDGISLEPDHFYSSLNVATMRDTWDKNTQNTFAGIKGGRPGDNHGHMDVGTFAFYSNGVRWTKDLSSDSYNLPNFWVDETPESGRWQYYRERAESHNTVFINPDQFGEFDPNVEAKISRFESKARGAIAVVDMTDSHNGKANSAKRAMQLVDERQSLVLRDEIELSGKGTVLWHMITEQNAEVSADNKSVIVREKINPSNYITIDFGANKDFELTVSPCKPLETSPEYDGMADDTDKSVIRLKLHSDSDVEITAKITPCTVESDSGVDAYDIPIDEWTVPDGELSARPYADSITVGGVEYLAPQKIIGHLVSQNDTEVPVVTAKSNYDVTVIPAKSLDEPTEIVIKSGNASAKYRVYFNKLQPIGIDGYDEHGIVKISASEEPQPENPVAALLDRNQKTRWSAEGKQYVILDMGTAKNFDTVIMSFMNGDSRKYNLKISVSSDGLNFTEVFSGTSGGSTTGYELFNVGVQNSRFVKVEGNGFTDTSSTGLWNSWTEIAVAASR